MSEIGGIVKAAVALLILGVVIAVPIVIGSAAIHFWYVSIPLAALIAFGIVRWKRQKVEANRV